MGNRDTVLLDPLLASALTEAGLATVDGLRALLPDAEATSAHVVVEIPLPGTTGRFHLKAYRYPTWRRSKGLLGRGTLWGRAPEINEFQALSWLRAHDLPAVRPVAACARRRRGRLVAHALMTEHVQGARDLSARLRTPSDAWHGDAGLRRRVLERVATTLSRMHALGFVHRDCHARNLLVADAAEPGVLLLDCRRGGQSSWRHGPLYDLATLDADLEGRVGRSERLRALRSWHGASEGLRNLHARVARRRDRLLDRARRRGRALR